MNVEDVEELAKQTLLSTEDVEFLANLFPGGGKFDLRIFPRGWGFWYDLIRAFVKSPYLPWVWGGFN